jgi:hypothetical protein
MPVYVDSDQTPADLAERALWHAELLSRQEWMAGADLGDPEPEDDDEAYFDDEDDPWNDRDTTCRQCAGTGGDPWNDGITPCEHCGGEGYEWWR